MAKEISNLRTIYLGTSYHVTQFYQAFPHIIVLQATNTGARRPGYEATRRVVALCLFGVQ